MHIIYFVSTGGGPEALLKNLSPIFQNQSIKVSVILPQISSNAAHQFPSHFELYELKQGSIIPYYLYRIFGKSKWLMPLITYLIRQEKENRLYNTLLEIEKRQEIDIVEVTEGQFINRISKKWTVFTRAHGSDWSFRAFCKDQDSSIDHVLIKWQRKQHLQSVRNFAISQHTQEYLTRVCNLPPNSIRFLPYPIPFDQFTEARPAKIKELPANAPLILSIGRLEKRKGMDTLVKAMPDVWKYFPEARLLLLGKETEFSIEQLRSSVSTEKRNHILYPGFIHYSEIPAHYKAATIYVSASQYETFGYTLLESMAAGCPVICTDRGAMPELITNNENGIVCQYGDPKGLSEAMLRLLTNANLRSQFALASLKKAKKYDLPRLGQDIIQAYYLTTSQIDL